VVGWSIDSAKTAALFTNAGNGDGQPRPRGRRDRSLLPRRVIHLLGLCRTCQGVGPGVIDGIDRRLLRQRDDQILTGAECKRSCSTANGGGRALSWPTRSASTRRTSITADGVLRHWHEHSARVRTATPIHPTRDLNQVMSTPLNPGTSDSPDPPGEIRGSCRAPLPLGCCGL
jgi:hypothetical protein